MGKVACIFKLLHLYLTLCDPMDYSYQAPLSMGFSRQEYWSEFLRPPLGIFLTKGLNLYFLPPLSLAGGFFAAWEDHRILSLNLREGKK